MRSIDLTSLTQTDTEYEKAALALNEKYKGNWDDEVHDSFRILLNKVEENRSNIHSISFQVHSIVSATTALDIDGLCSTAKSLCREVQSL